MNIQKKLIGFLTIVEKELRRVFRIWQQTLLPPAITTILYFVIFGHVIGARVGLMGGYPYVQFIAPGLIMMSIITNAYSGSVSSFFSAKFQRNIEEVLVSPMPNWIILFGFMAGGIVRGVMTGVIVSVIALFFTHLHVHSWLAIFSVAVLASALFSLAGIINAIYAKNFDDISIIPTFVLTPLTYLGGVFYSITLLPKFWQVISMANPIVYIVGNFRFGFLNFKESHVAAAFIMMGVFVLLLYLIALNLLRKSVGLRS